MRYQWEFEDNKANLYLDRVLPTFDAFRDRGINAVETADGRRAGDRLAGLMARIGGIVEAFSQPSDPYVLRIRKTRLFAWDQVTATALDAVRDVLGVPVDECHEVIGAPYRPSNGSEGDAFMETWCEHCRRHDEEDSCPIIDLAMLFDVGDPGYPSEWYYDADGRPKCAAFDPREGRS